MIRKATRHQKGFKNTKIIVVNEPSVNATNVFCFRYIRSGVEMLRMADTYFDEENHEKAYILYHKFVTLFVQKVLHNIFVTGSLFSPFIIVKMFQFK
jgi:hypothetical protein